MAQQSQTGPSLKVPRIIINIGKLLQSISPDLATKYVRFLFQKPIKHKMPEGEKPWFEKADINFIAVPEIDKSIAVYKWGEGDKKALVVHGWSGRATQLFKIIDALLKEGYEVYSFDAPAHGKSTGKKTMMPEYIKTIQKISEVFGPFEIAVGHSMGGISLLNTQGEKPIFKKLVVIGTPDSIFNIFNGFVKMLELKPIVAEKLIAVFEKITGKSIFEFHGSNNTKKIKEPILIIHDKQDKEVPLVDAENNYKQAQNAEIFITEGLGHNRILKNKEVIDKIIDFVRK